MFFKKQEDTTARVIVDETVVSVGDLKRRAKSANRRFWALVLGSSLTASMVLPYMSLASTIPANNSEVFTGYVLPGYSMGGVQVTAYGVDLNKWGKITKDTAVGSTYGIWSGSRLQGAQSRLESSQVVDLFEEKKSTNYNLTYADKSQGWQEITGRTSYTTDNPDGQQGLSQSNQYDYVMPYRTVADYNFWDGRVPSSNGNASASVTVSLFADFIIVGIDGNKATVLMSPDDIEADSESGTALLSNSKGTGKANGNRAIPYYVPLSALFDGYNGGSSDLTSSKDATIQNLLQTIAQTDPDGTKLATIAQGHNLLEKGTEYSNLNCNDPKVGSESSTAFNPYPYSMVFSMKTDNGEVVSSAYNNSEAYVYFSPSSAYTQYMALRTEYEQIRADAARDIEANDPVRTVQLGYYLASMAILEAYLDEALPQDMTRGYVGPSEPSVVANSNSLSSATENVAGNGKMKASLHITGSAAAEGGAEAFQVVSYSTLMYDVVKAAHSDMNNNTTGAAYKLGETNAIMDTLSVFGYASETLPGVGVMKGLEANELQSRFNMFTPYYESAYKTREIQRKAKNKDGDSASSDASSGSSNSSGGGGSAGSSGGGASGSDEDGGASALGDSADVNSQAYHLVVARMMEQFGLSEFEADMAAKANIMKYGDPHPTGAQMAQWKKRQQLLPDSGLNQFDAVNYLNKNNVKSDSNIELSYVFSTSSDIENAEIEKQDPLTITPSTDTPGSLVGIIESLIKAKAAKIASSTANTDTDNTNAGMYIPPYYPIQQHKMPDSEKAYRFQILSAVPYSVLTQYIKTNGFSNGVSFTYSSGGENSISKFTTFTQAQEKVALRAAQYEMAATSSEAAELYLGSVDSQTIEKMMSLGGDSKYGAEDLYLSDPETATSEDRKKVTAARIDAALLGYSASSMTADNVHDMFDIVRSTVGIKWETWFRFYNPIKSEGGDTDLFVTRISPALTTYLPAILINGYTAAGGNEIAPEMTTVNCSFDYYSTPSFAPCFASHTADNCYYGVLTYEQRAFFSRGFLSTLPVNAGIPAIEAYTRLVDQIEEMQSEADTDNAITWVNLATLYIMAKRLAFVEAINDAATGQGFVSIDEYNAMAKEVGQDTLEKNDSGLIRVKVSDQLVYAENAPFESTDGDRIGRFTHGAWWDNLGQELLDYSNAKTSGNVDLAMSLLYKRHLNSLLGKGGTYYWEDMDTIKNTIIEKNIIFSISDTGGGGVYSDPDERDKYTVGYHGGPFCLLNKKVSDPEVISDYKETIDEAATEIGKQVINLLKNAELLKEAMPNQMQNCLAWADYQNASDSENQFETDPTQTNVTVNVDNSGSSAVDTAAIEQNGVTSASQLEQYGVHYNSYTGDEKADEIAGTFSFDNGMDTEGNMQSRMVRGVEGSTWTATTQPAEYTMSATVGRVDSMASVTGTTYPYSGLANGRLLSGTDQYAVMQSHVIDYTSIASGIAGDLALRQRPKIVSISNPEYTSIDSFLDILSNLSGIFGELGGTLLKTMGNAFSKVMFGNHSARVSETNASDAAKSGTSSAGAAMRVYTTASGITMNRLPASVNSFNAETGFLSAQPIYSSGSSMANAAGLDGALLGTFRDLLLTAGNPLYTIIQTIALTMVMVFIGYIAFHNFYAYSIASSESMLRAQMQLKVVLPRSILAIFMIGLPPISGSTIGFEGGNFILLSLISNVMQYLTEIFFNLNGAGVMSIFNIDMAASFGVNIAAYFAYFVSCLILALCFAVGIVCCIIQQFMLFGFYLAGPIAWAFYVWPYSVATEEGKNVAADVKSGGQNAGIKFADILTTKLNLGVFSAFKAGNLAPMGMLFNYVVIAGLMVAWVLMFWLISMIFLASSGVVVNSSAASAGATVMSTGYPQATAALLGSANADAVGLFGGQTYAFRIVFSTTIAVVAFFIMQHSLRNVFKDTIQFNRSIAGKVGNAIKTGASLAMGNPGGAAATVGQIAKGAKIKDVAGTAKKARDVVKNGAEALTSKSGKDKIGNLTGKALEKAAKAAGKGNQPSLEAGAGRVAEAAGKRAADAAKKAAKKAEKSKALVTGNKIAEAAEKGKGFIEENASKGDEKGGRKRNRLSAAERTEKLLTKANDLQKRKQVAESMLNEFKNGNGLGAVGSGIAQLAKNGATIRQGEIQNEVNALSAAEDGLKGLLEGTKTVDDLDRNTRALLTNRGAIDENGNLQDGAREALAGIKGQKAEAEEKLEANKFVSGLIDGTSKALLSKPAANVEKAIAAASTINGNALSAGAVDKTIEREETLANIATEYDLHGSPEEQRVQAERILAAEESSDLKHTMHRKNAALTDAKVYGSAKQAVAVRSEQLVDQLSALGKDADLVSKQRFIVGQVGQPCDAAQYVELSAKMAAGATLTDSEYCQMVSFNALSEAGGEPLPADAGKFSDQAGQRLEVARTVAAQRMEGTLFETAVLDESQRDRNGNVVNLKFDGYVPSDNSRAFVMATNNQVTAEVTDYFDDAQSVEIATTMVDMISGSAVNAEQMAKNVAQVSTFAGKRTLYNNMAEQWIREHPDEVRVEFKKRLEEHDAKYLGTDEKVGLLDNPLLEKENPEAYQRIYEQAQKERQVIFQDLMQEIMPEFNTVFNHVGTCYMGALQRDMAISAVNAAEQTCEVRQILLDSSAGLGILQESGVLSPEYTARVNRIVAENGITTLSELQNAVEQIAADPSMHERYGMSKFDASHFNMAVSQTVNAMPDNPELRNAERTSLVSQFGADYVQYLDGTQAVSNLRLLKDDFVNGVLDRQTAPLLVQQYVSSNEELQTKELKDVSSAIIYSALENRVSVKQAASRLGFGERFDTVIGQGAVNGELNDKDQMTGARYLDGITTRYSEILRDAGEDAAENYVGNVVAGNAEIIEYFFKASEPEDMLARVKELSSNDDWQDSWRKQEFLASKLSGVDGYVGAGGYDVDVAQRAKEEKATAARTATAGGNNAARAQRGNQSPTAQGAARQHEPAPRNRR